MTAHDSKFDKFQFDTDFFEVLTPAEIARAEEAEQAKEQAYAEGFSAGQRKQQEEMQAQLNTQIQTLQSITNEIKNQQDVYAIALGRQALMIIEQTLAQLLDHATEHFPQDILEKHLRDVIPHLPKTMPLTLKIHPDATTFHEKLNASEANIGGCPFIIEPDKSIAPGDCVVIWKNGGIEASLKQAKEQLHKLLTSTPPDPQGTLPPEETAASDSSIEEPQTTLEAPEEAEPEGNQA